LSGKQEIARRVTAYRDSIQYLWDQTVRWTNRGATGPELAHRIHLPAMYDEDWLTQQHYGLAEHHVRQIRTGLFGFFDGDPVGLLPLDTTDEAERMVSAMGGAEKVRRLCVEALAGTDNDRRWALSLAGRLAHRVRRNRTNGCSLTLFGQRLGTRPQQTFATGASQELSISMAASTCRG
jgi:alkyl sulfatase BDS1-like metallo-beta-lactamase superfamily hydrolase